MNVYNSGISGNVVSKNLGKSEVSKDGFLKILAAQLQNQDPMNTKDNSEYVAQMAQFSALEQMQNLNSSITDLISREKFQEGNLMIGKIAKISSENNQFVIGEVTGSRLVAGATTILVDGKEYKINDVVELSQKV